MADNDFLSHIREIILQNLENESFGVSELADETGMSRSNLLRKIKKSSGTSASQYIRQVRLQKSMELLKNTSMNVSEVSYKVGFGSVSYYVKCFREFYGYPPGETGKNDREEILPVKDAPKPVKRNLILAGGIVILVVVALFFLLPDNRQPPEQEKSIAVLPFINDSNDSSNIYLVNGLMESLLNDLQKIRDLKVISRTSVEKYRYQHKTIPEMGTELGVRYFVEGSGQKIGDQILLHIQLIEASTDKHLWSMQYKRKTDDIFDLQREVAGSIASAIEAVITPAEQEQINKIPTNNLVAYDYFLKARHHYLQGTLEGLEKALPLFKKAIEEDPEFAFAYADVAISYYYLDIYKKEKQHSDQISYYADKALLYDPNLSQSMIAKALSHMNRADYKQALPYFEKALELNPNSAMVINFLSEYYVNYMPNTAKYLEYALKGIQLNPVANDSSTASFLYLHISNALIQSGFVREAEEYIEKSIRNNPENIYSLYLNAYIRHVTHRDLKLLKNELIFVFEKDTTRLDVLQEIGKVCFYIRDYESAYQYFSKFLAAREALHFDIYRGENAKIALVMSKTGHPELAKELLDDYKDYADHDQSIYKHLSLSVYFASKGDKSAALKHLKLFSKQENIQYWIILYLGIDPLMDPVKDLPEFNRTLETIENKFWEGHYRTRTLLEENNLLISYSNNK